MMWSKIEPIPLPQLDGEPKQYSDKIRTLVEEISSLTLSETAQLSELLKVTTNTMLEHGWLGSYTKGPGYDIVVVYCITALTHNHSNIAW